MSLLLLFDLFKNIGKFKEPVKYEQKYEGDLANGAGKSSDTLIIAPF